MRKITMLFLIIAILAFLSGCDKSPAHPVQSDYTPIDFDTLKVDLDKVRGVKVKISGSGLLTGDVLMISKETGSLASISVDIKSLSTDERKSILTKCSNSRIQCNIVVYGIVGTVNYKYGIIAHEIEFF